MAPDPCADLTLAVAPNTAAKGEASCSVVTPPEISPDEVRAVARKFANQPIQETETGVSAVLTAISENARLQPQAGSSEDMEPCISEVDGDLQQVLADGEGHKGKLQANLYMSCISNLSAEEVSSGAAKLCHLNVILGSLIEPRRFSVPAIA